MEAAQLWAFEAMGSCLESTAGIRQTTGTHNNLLCLVFMGCTTKKAKVITIVSISSTTSSPWALSPSLQPGYHPNNKRRLVTRCKHTAQDTAMNSFARSVSLHYPSETCMPDNCSQITVMLQNSELLLLLHATSSPCSSKHSPSAPLSRLPSTALIMI
jgi:hypothetical protein